MTRRFALILAAAVGGFVSPAQGQALQPWSELAPRGVSLAVLRPAFDGGGTSALTTINEIGVRWALGSVVLVGELPFVNAKADGASSGALLIGNPFLGVASPPTSSFIGELGVRVPVASASTAERQLAQFVGFIGDFMDLEAYGEDLLTIRGTAGYRYRSPSHFGMRVAVRPTFVAPVGSGSGDSELFLDYGIQGGYETKRASVGMVFNGRALVTEPGGSIGERTVHELGLGGSMTFGRVRPGVIVRLPLDRDLTQALNYSVGVRLESRFLTLVMLHRLVRGDMHVAVGAFRVPRPLLPGRGRLRRASAYLSGGRGGPPRRARLTA